MFNFFHKKDDDIQRDVQSELMWDPRIHSEKIGVRTKDGVVTLTGSVPHFYERYNAADAAHRVGGVKSVDDQIEVSLPSSFVRTDGEIKEAAKSALEWNYLVPEGVAVEVDDGWVTLTGKVEWDYQRNAAADTVRTLLGVYGVNDEISIQAKKVDSSAVKSQIQDALKRSAAVEGRNISVEVNGGKVTLSGSLDSYAEIETARIAAWNAPGVLTVVNDLTIAQ